MKPQQYNFKVIVIGPAGAGKTSIVKRMVSEDFIPDYKATLGVDFSMLSLMVSGIQTRLQFWDLSGQEQTQQINRAFYKNAHGCIMVVDLTNEELPKQVQSWLKTLENQLDVPIILMLNKIDIPSNVDRSKSLTPGLNDLKRFRCIANTSAKTGDGLKDVVEELVKIMIKNQDEKVPEEDPLSNINIQEPTKKKCC